MDDLADVLLNIASPMQFMCQALGISPADANELDNVLYEHIQRCIPPGGLNLMVGQTSAEQKGNGISLDTVLTSVVVETVSETSHLC